MNDLLESAYDPCPCGFPCELYRRYTTLDQRLGEAVWRRGRGNITRAVDELSYRSYASNRGHGVTPEHWARAFPHADVEAMERRYQAEQDRQRHDTIEHRAFQPIWPFEPTR